jgi:hypothetical protein
VSVLDGYTHAELAIPRRAAQVELSLAVVTEMTRQPRPAARAYARLAVDERLSARDRARARLWIGTALSKDGQHGHAATRAEGLALLDGTAGLAAASGLSHQLTTIESLRRQASLHPATEDTRTGEKPT